MSSHKDRLSHILNHLQCNATASKLTSKLTFVLITGCNRGIGYGLVEYLLRNRANYFVIATCRNPNKSQKLQTLITQYPGRSALISLDVSSQKSVDKSVEKVLKFTNKLHILINNAAMAPSNHPWETVLEFDSNEMRQILNTNVVGPSMMFKAYHKLLTNDNKDTPTKVINVSSSLGSLEMTGYRGWYDTDPIDQLTTTSYRASKAALNMLTRSQAAQVGVTDNIIVLSMAPGHVTTDLGTSYGTRKAGITVKESCDGMVKLIEKMDMTYNGSFYDWQHNKVPW